MTGDRCATGIYLRPAELVSLRQQHVDLSCEVQSILCTEGASLLGGLIIFFGISSKDGKRILRSTRTCNRSGDKVSTFASPLQSLATPSSCASLPSGL